MKKKANMWIDVFNMLVYRSLWIVVLYESPSWRRIFVKKKANMWIDVFYVLVYRSLRDRCSLAKVPSWRQIFVKKKANIRIDIFLCVSL